MNKKLLTIAVGAALAASAAVAQADVTVYGLAHVSVDYVDIDTAPTPNPTMPWNVSNNSSRFGVKAKEDLGGGWAGLAQFEIFVDNTEGNLGNVVNANRNNFVGIEQKAAGQLLFGRMDSAVKDVGGIADLFYREQIGESRAIINYGGTDARNSESVTFNSAKFGPVSFKLQWTANDSYTNTNNGYNANVKVDVKPVTIGVSYFNVENTAEATDGYRAAVKAVFGPATVAALYQQVNGIGGVAGADRSAYGIGASFKFLGKNTVKAQYYVADTADNASPGAETGASLFAVGYDYNFSKTTVVYAAWAKVENDANTVSFGLGGNGHGESYSTLVAGGSVSGISIGTRIAF